MAKTSSTVVDPSTPVEFPLLVQLQGELQRAGLRVPTPMPRDQAQAASWYLSTIEVMAAAVARGDGTPPMTSPEVAMLCRCTLTATTLREVIRLAADFCHMIHPRGGALDLSVEGDSAQFTMNPLRQRDTRLACLVDSTGLYSYLQLFSWLIGRSITPSLVQLGSGHTEVVRTFTALFGCPVSAAERVYSWRFDANLLEAAVVRMPAELNRFLVGFPCNVFGGEAQSGIEEQVRALMQGALYQGNGPLSREALADLLGVSTSTLRRRLQESGTSYNALREHCTLEAAQTLLARGDLSIESIASRLGFSDASTFRRAFQRWTGQAPTAWRR